MLELSGKTTGLEKIHLTSLINLWMLLQELLYLQLLFTQDLSEL